MTQLETRPYQDRIFQQALQYLNEPAPPTGHSLMIESPTGSGKTVLGMKLIKHLEDQGHKIGWMAHRRELLHQAQKTNGQWFNCQSVRFISIFTNEPTDYQDCTVICLDEAQHGPCHSAQLIYDIIRPKIIVGLTATPYRADKASLCFQKVIRDAGIHQLIREGYLSEYKQWIMANEWTPTNVARVYLDNPHQWGRSAIYFLTIDEAVQCNNILRGAGIASEVIIGNSPREDILNDFENGKLQVLTNVTVLTEGWDSPQLQTSFVRPSSRGPTVQMAGRAFRKHPSKQFVNIVQNQETKYPFTRHARPLDQFVQEHGKWSNISPMNLDEVFKEQRQKIASAIVEIPDFLRKKINARSPFTDIMSNDH